ncbi:DUF2695 domain-containing protein [Occultella glacieicola]|uniref:DUF2695 domain-containing protein n=1 Tax=Occultella glacieicola TaxID=2518684 RepID=UPI0038B413E1
MITHVQQLEGELARLSQALTAVRPGECALCYVQRMLTNFDCDGTSRWVRRWAAQLGPGASLRTELTGPHGESSGVVRSVPPCDCDLFWSGWEPVIEAPTGRPAWPDPDRGCPELDRPTGAPEASRACAPCRIWQRRRDSA